MREFETNLIVQPEISDEGLAAIRERLDGILEKNGAIRLLWDDQGKRRLAYEIKNFQKGHYLTLYYLDGGAVVQKVERSASIDESIIRFLTIQAKSEVGDVEARKAEAAELEKEHARRAAERAARDAEEAAERAAREEADREAREAEAKAAEEKASAAAEEESESDEDGAGESDAGDEDSTDDASDESASDEKE